MAFYQNLAYRHVRLLRLHPGSGDDPLCVTLESTRLDDRPIYEALSYVWGDPKITKPIQCDGEVIEITLNLFSALVCFRLPDKQRILWADAICINQQNLDERAQQVQMMHSIYRSCQTCLVWLGPEDEHLPIALSIIRSLVSIVCTRLSIPEAELDNHLEQNGRDMFQAQEIGFNGLPDPDPRVWGSLLHFFGRPWFSRAWVVQEVHFAPKARFFCNRPIGSFSALFHTADWILTNAQHIKWAAYPETVGFYQNSQFGNLLFMKSDKESAKNRWLEDVLRSSKGLQATDPRDKVYAMMNLPPFKREYPDLLPDYHKAAEDVFADVAFAILKHRKTLSVLTHVDNVPENHIFNVKEENFPSWVPRWHREDLVPNVSCAWYHHFYAGISLDSPPLTMQLLSGNILSFSGVEFDVIQDICLLEPRGHQKTHLDKPNFYPTQSWKPYDPESSHGPYQSKVDIVAAYAMTFTAMTREHRGIFPLKCAPENYAHHTSDFVAWLQWLRTDEGAKTGHYPPGLYSEDTPCLTGNTNEEAHQFAMRYQTMFKSVALGRSLVRTEKGFLGLARYTAQKGDMVCVAFGGALPLLLRERPDGGYAYIGDVYIHGIMHGEALPGAVEGVRTTRDFKMY